MTDDFECQPGVWTGVAITAQIICSKLNFLLDYICSGLLEQKLIYNQSKNEYSELPLGLGQSSAISLMLPRQFDLVIVHV